MDNKAYLLRIELKDIKPKIWRVFTVPANITLDRLTDVIKIVMGWRGAHLSELKIAKKRYMEFPESEQQALESGLHRLNNIVKKKKTKFTFLYDFGDNWEHELTFMDTIDLDEEYFPGITCIDGARCCPPDDIGGIPGYLNACEIVNTPGYEEYEDFQEWYDRLYGDYFDPDYFEEKEVNRELGKFINWSRDRFDYWIELDKEL